MIYLAANNTGCFRLAREGFPIGMMMSPAGARRPVRGELALPWAADNQMFHPYGTPAKPPSEQGAIYGMLAKAAREDWPVPMFAVVPDKPYDARETFRRLDRHAPLMREMFPDVPLALAVQDGMSFKTVLYLAPRMGLKWIFVGGSDGWKDRTLAEWVSKSHACGLKCHVARVNDTNRLRAARDAGADSADGTGIWRGDKKQKQRVLAEIVQNLLPVGSAA